MQKSGQCIDVAKSDYQQKLQWLVKFPRPIWPVGKNSLQKIWSPRHQACSQIGLLSLTTLFVAMLNMSSHVEDLSIRLGDDVVVRPYGLFQVDEAGFDHAALRLLDERERQFGEHCIPVPDSQRA